MLEASVFPAIQNLLLTATALGLGSSLTTLPLVFGAELAAIVELPAPVLPHGRHPYGLAGARRCRRLGASRFEKAHRETFGTPW